MPLSYALTLLLALHGAARVPASAAVCRVSGPPSATYWFELTSPDGASAASGSVLMVPIPSPFGVATSADGHLRYTLHLTLKDLPAPATTGVNTVYVAWMVTPLLDVSKRLGVVHNGQQDLGEASWNKFRVIITAEPGADSASVRQGPVILRGLSPSGKMRPHDYSNLGIGGPC